MTLYVIISIVFLIAYFVFIIVSGLFLERKALIINKVDSKELNTYSIIVVFRNEENNLINLVSDLKKLNFDESRFEVIFIDDNSTDNSIDVLNDSEIPNNYKILRSPGKGKKRGVYYAIENSEADYIYSIDADCRLQPDILKNADNYLNISDVKLLIQPVISIKNKGLLSRFQYYDYHALLGVNYAVFSALGKPVLASAANLIYSRSVFNRLKPFEGNMNVASGDDMFLLNAFLKDDSKSVGLNYSRSSLIYTEPETNWGELIKQRIRWAGKMKYLTNSSSFFLGLFSVSVQFVLLALLFMGLFDSDILILFTSALLLKSLVDYHFINKTSKLLDKSVNWLKVLMLEPVYIFFVPIVFIMALFYKPKWKGRG